MTAAARIYRFAHPESQEIILADTAEACRLLQRELARLVQTDRKRGAMHRLAKRCGMNDQTVSRLLYGETSMPRFGTVIRLLDALGFTLVARR